MLSIRIESLIVGVALLAGGIWMVFDQRDVAKWLHSWYHHLPDPKWRPSWLPWRFRPTEKQASVMAWLLIAAALVFGLYSVLYALGVDQPSAFP